MIGHAKTDSETLVGDFSIQDMESITKTRIMHSNNQIESVAVNPGLWRMIFKSSSLADCRFEDYRMGEDQLFLLKYKLFNRKVQFFDLNLYTYFKNVNGQLTSNRDAVHEIKKVFSETFKIFTEAQPYEKKFVAIMLIRQILTVAKHVNSHSAIRVFSNELLKNSESIFQDLNMLIRSSFFLLELRRTSD
jgi:hypothetical protein